MDSILLLQFDQDLLYEATDAESSSGLTSVASPKRRPRWNIFSTESNDTRGAAKLGLQNFDRFVYLVYFVYLNKLLTVTYTNFYDIVDNLEQNIHEHLVPYGQVSAANDVCISATGKWEIRPALGFALCDCCMRISAVSLIFRKDAFDTESDALDYCNDLLLEDYTNWGFWSSFDFFRYAGFEMLQEHYYRENNVEGYQKAQPFKQVIVPIRRAGTSPLHC